MRLAALVMVAMKVEMLRSKRCGLPLLSQIAWSLALPPQLVPMPWAKAPFCRRLCGEP